MLEESSRVLLLLLLLVVLLLSCGVRHRCAAGAGRRALGAAAGGQHRVKQQGPQVVLGGKLSQAALIRQVTKLCENAARGGAAAPAGGCPSRVIIQII